VKFASSHIKCLFEVFILAVGMTYQATGQDTLAYNHSLSIEPVKGFIYAHTQEIEHLITDQPTGIILSLNKHTYGAKPWQSRYNFLDVGYSFYYLDHGNPTIGKTLAVMPYYNFYFNKNHEKRSDIIFKMAFGLGYNTNPYDKITNNKNNFFGSSFAFGTQLQMRYDYQVSPRMSLKSGVSIIHFSNASIRRPNKGINLVVANIGVQYALSNYEITRRRDKYSFEKEPIKYSVALSFGSSETTTIGAGSFPFYVLHTYAHKKIGHKSALQLGTDFFLTQSIKEDIKYDSFLAGDEPDYKRIGLFIGHEWYINRLSLVTQFGYYVYRPYDSFKVIYQRVNLKYYLTDKVFAGFSLKTHFAKAEAAEFGIGIQL
jgi:hypothetical protein